MGTTDQILKSNEISREPEAILLEEMLIIYRDAVTDDLHSMAKVAVARLINHYSALLKIESTDPMTADISEEIRIIFSGNMSRRF